MKKFVIILTILIVNTINIVAQNPNWVWAKNAGYLGDDKGKCITTDPSGNIYITGSSYSSSITFGSFTLINPDSTNDMIFLVKYDSNGNAVWARKVDGGGNSNSITHDLNGNIYITGEYYSDSISFGTETLVNYDPSTWDIFLVKYDSDGNVQWAKNGETTYTNGFMDDCYGVAADSDGNIYITGTLSSQQITFGGDTLLKQNVREVFFVKYDNGGNLLWDQIVGNAGGSDEHGYYSTCIATDINNDIYITGTFRDSSLTFGSYILENPDGSGNDIFTVKFNSSGSVLWAKSVQSDWYQESNYITTDINGNVFISGSFEGTTLIFDSLTLTNNGNSPNFITKYDASGNVEWVNNFGTGMYDAITSIALDGNGNVYATGNFTGSPMMFGNDTIPNSDSIKSLILKCDNNGDFAGLACINGWVTGNSITVSSDNNIYITGIIDGQVPFGSDTLTSNEGEDFYVARLNNLSTNIIKPEVFDNIVNVYPNPASNTFILNIDKETTNTYTLVIYTIKGEKVRTEKLHQNQQEINIGNLNNGMYLLEIKSDKYNEMQKLIIQR